MKKVNLERKKSACISVIKSGGISYILIILSVILTIILGVLLYYSHIQELQREASIKVLLQQEHEKQLAQKEEQQRLELELQEKKEVDSFYQKLVDGFDVNVLVVGDSIGEGAGASDADHMWSTLLQNEINESFGVLVNLTNVSMGVMHHMLGMLGLWH